MRLFQLHEVEDSAEGLEEDSVGAVEGVAGEETVTSMMPSGVHRCECVASSSGWLEEWLWF